MACFETRLRFLKKDKIVSLMRVHTQTQTHQQKKKSKGEKNLGNPLSSNMQLLPGL